MKKIKKYSYNSFEFHENVVDSKYNKSKDPTYKDRINALNSDIQEQFEDYDKKFKENNLASLSPKMISPNQKKDLIALYNYSAKPFKILYDELTTGENKTRQPICPFCTINNSNTLDHLIPKSEFAEFSDHPVNLMPCCSECNSKKASTWRTGNIRKYLNLYLDDLPDLQYLFPNLSIDGATLRVEFFVENRYNIDKDLFKKIQNHYNDLNLCARFSLNSDNVITELKNLLKSFQHNIEKEEMKKLIIENEKKNCKFYGFNYWKSILKIECCTNDDVFVFLLK